MSPLLSNHPYKAGKRGSGEVGILALNILWPLGKIDKCSYRAGVGNVRSPGRIRPAKAFRPDRGGKARQKKKQRKKSINRLYVYIFL